MTLKTAWQKVKSQRRVVQPNYRFSQALLRWEEKVQGGNSMSLEELCPKGPKNGVSANAKSALDRFNDSSDSGSGSACTIL